MSKDFILTTKSWSLFISKILFSSPVSDIYLNSISNDDQKNFEDILKEISKNQKVEVIFLHDKFRHDSIWNDPPYLTISQKFYF